MGLGIVLQSLICDQWTVPLPNESPDPLSKWRSLGLVDKPWTGALDCLALMVGSCSGHLFALAPASPPVTGRVDVGYFIKILQL